MPVTWHGPEPGIGLASAKLSQIPYSFDNTLVANEVFPEGELDADLQQVDLRKRIVGVCDWVRLKRLK
jgi:hypothetical protein